MAVDMNTHQNNNNLIPITDILNDISQNHTSTNLHKFNRSKFLFFGHTSRKLHQVHDYETAAGTRNIFESVDENGFGKNEIQITDNGTENHNENDNENTDKNKLSCYRRIIEICSDEDSTPRLLVSTFCIIIFSLVAAGIFYGIEHGSEKCRWNYWKSLWFVNTIYTTIGYGTLEPCTNWGRAAAVCFALFGIPLNVWALSDVGQLLNRLLTAFWQRVVRKIWHKCRSKVKGQKHAITFVHDRLSASDIPLSFGAFITFSWFALSVLFFTLTEYGMNFSDSFYFVMISVTTVGFGDVAPVKYYLVIAQFFFIIIGVSLFSMVINIVQDKIDALSDNVLGVISKEYTSSQVNGDLSMVTDEKMAREHVKQMIKKQKGGGALQMVMGKSMQNRLVENYLEKSRKRLMATQTDNEVDDKEITAAPDTDHVMIQVDALTCKFADTKNRSTQLDWMPKIWQDYEWMHLKSAKTSATADDSQINLHKSSNANNGENKVNIRMRSASVEKSKFVRKSSKRSVESKN